MTRRTECVLGKETKRVYVDGKVAGIIVKEGGKILAITEEDIQQNTPGAWKEHASMRKAVKALEKWGGENPESLGRDRW